MAGDEVIIRHQGRIALGGPPDREGELRERLERRLLRQFDKCPMFRASGLSERMAFQIAWSAPYQTPRRRSRATICKVLHLDVIYQNPPKAEKWWARIRHDRGTVDPGTFVGDEYVDDVE